MTATIVTAKQACRRVASTRAALLCLLGMVFGGQRLPAQGTAGGYFIIPGDVKAGMKTFFDKGCIRCHSVLGEGGKSAPDLGRAPAGHMSAAELVAAMWNHAPQMWTRMQQEKVTAPAFTRTEMSNLFAFLYSVRSLDEPGDPQRGRQLLAEKRCLECHGQGKILGRTRAPDLREWGSYRNPVSWIQAMWNHGPVMQASMEARGLSWPEFQSNDIADLIAYIRTQAKNPQRHFYLQPPNPEAGKLLFRQKGCANCHSLHSAGRASAPALSSRSLPRTLGQFAAQMWNHSPAMWASMKAQNVPRPQFSNKEMADLIAFLFVERYFEASGNVQKGKTVFAVKGCPTCHGKGGLAPDLAAWQGRVSPVDLATAMWNHGPAMLGHMRERQIPWPVFQPGEMMDLMEFLNASRSNTRIAELR